MDADIFLAHEANQWTMGRRWLRWGTADLGPRAHTQRMGRAMPQAIMGRARPRQTRGRRREKQWPHFGKSTTRSTHGKRSVHRRTTNRSSMACALPASFSNGGWKDPQHLEGQNSVALAYAHAALDIHGKWCMQGQRLKTGENRLTTGLKTANSH